MVQLKRSGKMGMSRADFLKRVLKEESDLSISDFYKILSSEEDFIIVSSSINKDKIKP